MAAHIYVPLSDLARSTLLSAIELISDEEEFVFPSPIEAGGPNHRTFPHRRDAPHGKKDRWRSAERLGRPIHPPRTICDERLQRDFQPWVSPKKTVMRVLITLRNDVGSKHYDQYERAAEKRKALGAWADQLRSIIGAEKSA